MLRSLWSKVVLPVSITRFTSPLINLKESIIKIRVDRKEARITKAHATLSSVVRELSEGSSKALALPTFTTLQKWDVIDLDQLSTDQLEDLGRAHLEGIEDEMPVNAERAVEIFKAAADRGSVVASYSFAACLKDGIGVKKDTTTAFNKLRDLANEKDFYLAHYAVGIMLTNNEVPRDDVMAFKHFDRAARLGVLPAIYNIGNFYSSGTGGVEQSDKKAYHYYFAAAQTGDPLSMFTLGSWIYQGRAGLERDLKEAFKWQKKAADVGHPGALFNIGTMYMAGEGTPRDTLSAVEYFEKAMVAGPGISKAAVNLGNIHRIGVENIPVDLVKARAYFAAFADRDELCATLMRETDEEIIASQNK